MTSWLALKELMTDHSHWMCLALREAEKAAHRGEVPVGAVLIKDGRLLSRGHNMTRTWRDPTAHAEIIVLQRASHRLKLERILDTILYVTLEPCAMCAGAIIQARVGTVVFGARDLKAGACGSVLRVLGHEKLNHRPKIIRGVMAEPCGEVLTKFFQTKRRASAALRKLRS